MTNLLVTGGAGFLGSHFVRSALADRLPGLEGARVTVLDKLTYAGNFANLGAVAHEKRLDFVPGDVADRPLVDTVLRGMDAIVNFAAEHPARSASYATTNVAGTQVLLDAALRHGVTRVVQVSTDAVYGAVSAEWAPTALAAARAGSAEPTPVVSDPSAWDEKAPLAPTSVYGATKAAADLLVLAAHRTHGLGVSIVRVCSVYGPHQHPEKTIPRFVTSLLDDRPLQLDGAGATVRNWLHVDDCARAVARVLAAGRAGEVYHVGGSLELPETQLARLVLNDLHQPWSRVETGPAAEARDHRRALDDTKIREELDWHPRVEFTTGLAGTIHWYRTNPSWWRPLLTS